MITRLSLFRGIIALLIVTCIMSAVSAANTTNATYFSEITLKDKLSTTGFEAIQQNQTECPSPSITGRLLICRSNESVIAVYDRHGRKIFTAEDLKKGASENVLSHLSTHINERVYGSNLVERAINGQFDQVKITFEQYLETDYWDPPTPAGWAFIGDEGETSMYWEPDDWSSGSYSDYHAVVFFSPYGHRSGIQTTLDASGGQYIRIAVGPKGHNPLEIFLDDILIGNITDNFSIQQFDISSRSWTTTSILKIVAAGGSEEWGTGSLVENISLMASDSLSAPVSMFDGNPLSGNAPLNVSFTDSSTGSPTSWNWSFGDGGTSALQNPSHVYTMAGTYTVSLTVTNAAGSNTSSKQNYISVTSPVTCDAAGPYIDFVIENVSCPERNSGAWYEAVCVDNAMIRWALAGKSTPFYANLSPWMWKRTPVCPEPGHSWAVDSPYDKPVYFVSVVNSDTANVWYHHHAVAAEYLGTGEPSNSTWQDWKFFNYNDLNITIGPDHQIPSGTQISNTTVSIKNITGVYGCGQGVPSTIISFSIDQNNSISTIPVRSFAKGYIVSDAFKAPFKAQNIPDALKNTLRSIKDNKQFSVSKWEFDPTSKKLTVYAYDIKNFKAIADIQREKVGPYPIQIVHDLEFEKNRADVQQQLADLKKNPDYQISWIFMNIDTINDPSENYVELWVHSTTPENKMLDNSMIKGWKILVYPIS